MRHMDVTEASQQLAALVESAAAGQTVIVTVAGVPRARLMPLATEASGSAAPAAEVPERRPGRGRGDIHIADDFDDPLPG